MTLRSSSGVNFLLLTDFVWPPDSPHFWVQPRVFSFHWCRPSLTEPSTAKPLTHCTNYIVAGNAVAPPQWHTVLCQKRSRCYNTQHRAPSKVCDRVAEWSLYFTNWRTSICSFKWRRTRAHADSAVLPAAHLLLWSLKAALHFHIVVPADGSLWIKSQKGRAASPTAFVIEVRDDI